ncbi:hypothetical protein HPP92_001778 [Vanilla planifolia]|uniref:K+ potassium transporter C-terminal domain-containing protein n=1 Tax=Vanilla planifolia TaxID=51239 RepID=A0A835S8D6_VANPL|nr:hypothetical protein HPP92_001992 [Vanilla planifolia]KAG0501706.1 hypothetical protein HPP92_001778 [Vanilla planifolia]
MGDAHHYVPHGRGYARDLGHKRFPRRGIPFGFRQHRRRVHELAAEQACPRRLGSLRHIGLLLVHHPLVDLREKPKEPIRTAEEVEPRGTKRARGKQHPSPGYLHLLHRPRQRHPAHHSALRAACGHAQAGDGSPHGEDSPRENRASCGEVRGREAWPGGVYRCLVQYGYMDEQVMDEAEYVGSVLQLVKEVAGDASEMEILNSAAGSREVIFVLGRIILHATDKNGGFRKWIINILYRFLQKNFRSSVSTLRIPPSKSLQVGMLYEV